jgi:hypothetical protein
MSRKICDLQILLFLFCSLSKKGGERAVSSDAAQYSTAVKTRVISWQLVLNSHSVTNYWIVASADGRTLSCDVLSFQECVVYTYP